MLLSKVLELHSGRSRVERAFVETTLFSHVSNFETFNFWLKGEGRANEIELYLIYTITPKTPTDARCTLDCLISIKTLINTTY